MIDIFFEEPIKVKDLKDNGYKLEYINALWWIKADEINDSAAYIKYYDGGEVEPSDDFEVESLSGSHCGEIIDDICQKLGVECLTDEEYFYGFINDADYIKECARNAGIRPREIWYRAEVDNEAYKALHPDIDEDDELPF